MHAANRKPIPELSSTATPMIEMQLRSFISHFSFDACEFGNQGFKRVLLQLFGYSGHGKSSFINTCLMVWNNTGYTNHSKALGADGGQTTERLSYPLTTNIMLVDNRGCRTMNAFETGEIFAQLANLLPLDKPVDCSKGFGLAERIVEAEPCVLLSDFIVPVFVYSARKSIAPGEVEDLKEMLYACKSLTGVFPIVVLTHKTDGRLEEIKKMFRDMGMETLFDLENYTEKNPKYSTETHSSVIRFLHEAVSDAKFQINIPQNPERERMERKISVLNYIHKRELKVNERKLQQQKIVEGACMNQTIRLQKEEAEKQKQQEQQEHNKQMRMLEEKYKRHSLWDQWDYEQRLKKIQKKRHSN